jgi:hypothetical protein
MQGAIRRQGWLPLQGLGACFRPRTSGLTGESRRRVSIFRRTLTCFQNDALILNTPASQRPQAINRGALKRKSLSRWRENLWIH